MRGALNVVSSMLIERSDLYLREAHGHSLQLDVLTQKGTNLHVNPMPIVPFGLNTSSSPTPLVPKNTGTRAIMLPLVFFWREGLRLQLPTMEEGCVAQAVIMECSVIYGCHSTGFGRPFFLIFYCFLMDCHWDPSLRSSLEWGFSPEWCVV